MIYFLHIPKAGGCTIHDIILQNYRKSKTYSYHVYNIPKSQSDLESKKYTNLDIAKGHFSFGFHEHFKDSDYQYFTFLRDPVKRIISHYFYAKRTKGHYLYDIINNDNISLEEYVSTDVCPEIENAQSKQIAGLYINDNFGYADRVEKKDIPNEELLKKAINNIENHFAFVGIMEHFDKSVSHMQKQLNLKPVNCFYIKRNVNTSKPKLEISDNIIKTIKERNACDIELYNFYLKQLEKEAPAKTIYSNPSWLIKQYLFLKRIKNTLI